MAALRTTKNRAPAGSRRVLGKVESYIRNHPDKAARYLKVSDSTARKVQHAVESGKPLSSVVKTQAGLDKWQERLTGAKRLSRAENTARKVRESKVTSERMENVSALTRKEIDKALVRMQKGLPVEAGIAREIARALKETKQQEPYQEKGVWIYPNKEMLDRDVKRGDWPQAVAINRFTPYKEDILNFIGEISPGYFVAVWDEDEEMFFVWDIRSSDERHDR
jgi:hypothetical protein